MFAPILLFGHARDGALVHGETTRSGLQVFGKVDLFDGDTVWIAPAMVGTTLYAEDQGRILALELGP